MKAKIVKSAFIILSILFMIPSVIYLIQNKTVMGFNIYFNFFLTNDISKTISAIVYLVIFVLLTILYLLMIKMKCFSNIKSILKFVAIIGIIFIVMLPWTSSDIFYYMGVGELNSRYGENPYYITMRQYYLENEQNIDDEILKQGAYNFWGNTTVVYGPIAQYFFSLCSFLGNKNISLAILVFKLVNLVIHIINTYLIYKISKKKIFSIIYGLNPFVLIEAIGNVHNDIITVFFVLLSLYFLLKQKKILPCILFLALATGIKYFTVLLLPLVILYHFRDEKRIYVRILRCMEYGLIFAVILLLEYIPYFKDYNIFLAMVVQTSRYSKSLYLLLLRYHKDILSYVRTIFILIFIYQYVILCIDLLLTKNINFYKEIRKYNVSIILFLLILTNFQQWYLIWLFATIMWQKPNTIRNIVGLGLCTEIANSTYLFLYESYNFDIYFIGIIVTLYLIWQIITNKNRRRINIERKELK